MVACLHHVAATAADNPAADTANAPAVTVPAIGSDNPDESRALIPAAPREPVPGARPADAATDPIIADLAHAVAAALVARLAPWLDHIAAALAERPATVTAPVEPPPILLSADAARVYCGGLAKSTWSDFDARGVVPAPVRVGGRVFWRRTDLDLWAGRDCPNRTRFAAIRDTENQPPAPRNARRVN